ncbi:hypothetical protein Tco_0365666 [Tanacetum coccineum]
MNDSVEPWSVNVLVEPWSANDSGEPVHLTSVIKSCAIEPVDAVCRKTSQEVLQLHRQRLNNTLCDATLKRVLEGLKSYNNDVKHGYVNPNLSNEDVEYLQLFEEEIDERLKHRDQMRRWEINLTEFSVIREVVLSEIYLTEFSIVQEIVLSEIYLTEFSVIREIVLSEILLTEFSVVLELVFSEISILNFNREFLKHISTSNTHQQYLADAGSKTRPTMLERGPYEFKEFTPSDTEEPRMQKEEDLRGDDLKHYEAEIEAMNLILISIPNEIYNSMDAYTTTQAMWQRVECLMRVTMQNKVDRETPFNNKFDQFVAEPGEALVSVYNYFAQLMNDMERNGIIFPKVTVNTKFLNCLQPEWLKYVTQLRLAKRLIEDSYDDLFDYIQQFEKLVNASRSKKLEKSHDPLALVAHTGSSSRTTSPYYVTHSSSMVDYDDDYQGDVVQNTYEDPLTSAMILLARAITQRFSNPTNNHVRTSSNTRNQAIVQADRVQIQSKNSGNDGRNTRLRKDEAGVILTDEQNDFLFADASRIEDIEELSANICLMARIQPTNFNFDAGPSYDSVFLKQQRDKLELSVVELKRQNVELQKTQSILKRKMSESEDKYHDTALDLEARAKKNADVVLKIGNSIQGMFMLEPKPMSFYDSNSKHGLGYENPYTLKKAISQNPKLYDASCLDDSKIHVNVRDTEDILDDATKSQIKMKNKLKDPIAIEKKQNVCTIDYKKSNALYEDFVPQKEFSAEQKYFSSSLISSENPTNASSPSSPFETKLTETLMPSANPMILDLNKMENDFKSLFALLRTNYKRESIFYTSPEEIRLTKFCQQEVKPILHNETWKQNELLKDQLLEAKLKQEIECCVLLSHECVNNNVQDEIEKIQKDSIEIQERMQKRINILENDVQRCKKQRLSAASSVRIPLNRDSPLKNIVLFNTKKSSEKVEVPVRTNRKTYVTSKNVVSNKKIVIDEDVKNALKAKDVLCVSCAKNVVETIMWIVDSVCSKHITGDRSLLKNFVEKFMGTVRFGNVHFAAITCYGDYVQGNIIVCHVYYVEGLGHNLLSVGQFCDSDLELAFHSNTCYVRNLEGDDLLTRTRESNLYTITISNMATSSPVCLLSKATSTKSWLWHKRLTHPKPL